MSYDPREFRYFYISYTMGGGMFGCMVLRQNQQIDGMPDNGLNISAATEMVMTQFKMPTIIVSWQEITHVRYTQWQVFLRKYDTGSQPALSLLKGDNAGKSEKSIATLKVIEPPPVKED